MLFSLRKITFRVINGLNLDKMHKVQHLKELRRSLNSYASYQAFQRMTWHKAHPSYILIKFCPSMYKSNFAQLVVGMGGR